MLKRYLEHLKTTGRKDLTLESYASAYRAFEKFMATTPIESTTGLDLRAWKSWMLKEGRAAGTINQRLIAMKAFFRWATEQGDVREEQLASIRAVPEIPITALGVRTLEPDLLRRFLRTVEVDCTKRDRAIVYLLYSGLRESEVVGLTVRDLTLNTHRGSVLIRGEHVKRSSQREVPLGRQARVYLLDHLEEKQPTDQVFVGERGPLTTDGIYKVVSKLGMKAGVEISPHQLRHEFSRRFLETNQNDLKGLQTLLGHSNIEITARHYARKRLSDLQVQVEKLEQ